MPTTPALTVPAVRARTRANGAQPLVMVTAYDAPGARMVADGGAGAEAVDAWVAAHKTDVERIRTAIHEIAASGLTLSKVTVAASLLSDLVKE